MMMKYSSGDEWADTFKTECHWLESMQGWILQVLASDPQVETNYFYGMGNVIFIKQKKVDRREIHSKSDKSPSPRRVDVKIKLILTLG